MPSAYPKTELEDASAFLDTLMETLRPVVHLDLEVGKYFLLILFTSLESITRYAFQLEMYQKIGFNKQKLSLPLLHEFIDFLLNHGFALYFFLLNSFQQPKFLNVNSRLSNITMFIRQTRFCSKSIQYKHMHYFKMQKLFLQVLFAQYVLSSGVIVLLFSRRISKLGIFSHFVGFVLIPAVHKFLPAGTDGPSVARKNR